MLGSSASHRCRRNVPLQIAHLSLLSSHCFCHFCLTKWIASWQGEVPSNVRAFWEQGSQANNGPVVDKPLNKSISLDSAMPATLGTPVLLQLCMAPPALCCCPLNIHQHATFVDSTFSATGKADPSKIAEKYPSCQIDTIRATQQVSCRVKTEHCHGGAACWAVQRSSWQRVLLHY